ncbi:MAG: hypothetical protein ACFFBF_09795 [Promethearchaeota archaeon]
MLSYRPGRDLILSCSSLTGESREMSMRLISFPNSEIRLGSRNPFVTIPIKGKSASCFE